MKPSRNRLLSTLPIILSLLAAQTGCASAAPPKGAYAASSVAAKSPSAPPSTESAPAAPSTPAAAGYPQEAPAQPAPPPSLAAKGATTLATPGKPADTKSAKNAGPTTRAPVIIYQGDLKMAADEEAIPKTIDKIIDVAESVGGHIASRKDTSVQIKVPSASFRDAMTKIESIGGVVGRSVTADDVSEEFHDLEVRLANLRTTRTRLQDFMTKAVNINDMLTVERELERVAQEIDRIEGRLEFLRTRAALSVISVQLSPKPKAAIVVAVAPPPVKNGVDLPIPWVGNVGIDPLLSLRK